MAVKCTKADSERRILAIQGWIIDGAQDSLILRQIQNEWGVGLRMARKYVKKAYENWKQDATIDIESRRSAKVAELQQLKRSLKEEFKGTPSGINAVGRIDKMIIRLQSLEPPRTLKLNVDTAPVIQVVDVAKNKPE